MAKSIRSKIKRKHRSEFRKTIGTEAYNKNMAKTQEKLKEYTESQQLNSLERLSKTLAVDNTADEASTPAMEMEEDTPVITQEVKTALEYRGENKAIPNRKMTRKTKHMLEGKDRKKQSAAKARAERPKPRFFCQF